MVEDVAEEPHAVRVVSPRVQHVDVPHAVDPLGRSDGKVRMVLHEKQEPLVVSNVLLQLAAGDRRQLLGTEGGSNKVNADELILSKNLYVSASGMIIYLDII